MTVLFRWFNEVDFHITNWVILLLYLRVDGMCKGYNCISGFVVIGYFPSLDNLETFFSVFTEKFIPEYMFSLQLTPHLTEVIHVELTDKWRVIGVFIVFGEDDFTEFGDVENDERLIVLAPFYIGWIVWVWENAVKMGYESWWFFALVILCGAHTFYSFFLILANYWIIYWTHFYISDFFEYFFQIDYLIN